MTVELIVAADEPALFFSSVKAAEQYLEAVDVEDGVYTAAYDPSGQPYEIRAAYNVVVVERDDDAPAAPEKLKALLLYRFESAGLPADESDDIATLLERCRPYIVW